MVGGEGLPPPHEKQYTTDGDEMQLRCGLKFYFSGAWGELQKKRGRSERSLALPNVVRSRGGPRFVAAASALSTTDAPLTGCPVVQMGECPMKESFVFIGTSFIRPAGQRAIRPAAADRSYRCQAPYGCARGSTRTCHGVGLCALPPDATSGILSVRNRHF